MPPENKAGLDAATPKQVAKSTRYRNKKTTKSATFRLNGSKLWKQCDGKKRKKDIWEPFKSAYKAIDDVERAAIESNENIEHLTGDFPDDPDLPLNFVDFEQRTNVMEVVRRLLQTNKEENTDDTVVVHKARMMYKLFYKQPKFREMYPLNAITWKPSRATVAEESTQTNDEIPAKKRRVHVSIKFDGESSFPVSYDDFERYTNLRQLAKDELRAKFKHSTSESTITKAAKKMYTVFYTHPDCRRMHPLYSLTVNFDCPTALRKRIFMHCKDAASSSPPPTSEDAVMHYDESIFFAGPSTAEEDNFDFPVTLNEFKRYTFCYDVVDELIKRRKLYDDRFREMQPNNVLREQVLKNYYHAFYTKPSVRSKVKLHVKSCPGHMKMRLLQNARCVRQVARPSKRAGESINEVQQKRRKIGATDINCHEVSPSNQINHSNVEDTTNNDSLPVTFSDFEQNTNLYALAQDDLNLKNVNLFNETLVLKKAIRLFTLYYKQPKCRNLFPLKNLKIASDCTPEMRKLILSSGCEGEGTALVEELRNEEPAVVQQTQKSPELRTKLVRVSVDPDDEAHFPVTFEQFQCATNIRDIAVAKVREGQLDSSDELAVTRCAHKLYMIFYTHSKYRKMNPLNKLRISDACNAQMRDRIMQKYERPTNAPDAVNKNLHEPEQPMRNDDDESMFFEDRGDALWEAYSFPVTLNEFRRFTDCYAVVAALMSRRAYDDDDAVRYVALREVVLTNYYLAFYTQPEIREKYQLQLRPCPAHVKAKMLREAVLKDTSAPAHSTQDIPNSAPKATIVASLGQTCQQKAPNESLHQPQPSESSTAVNQNKKIVISVNLEDEKKLPVSFAQFDAYTNVRAIATAKLSEKLAQPSGASVTLFARKLYITYYMHDECRAINPLWSLRIQSDCPSHIRRLIWMKLDLNAWTRDDGSSRTAANDQPIEVVEQIPQDVGDKASPASSGLKIAPNNSEYSTDIPQLERHRCRQDKSKDQSLLYDYIGVCPKTRKGDQKESDEGSNGSSISEYFFVDKQQAYSDRFLLRYIAAKLPNYTEPEALLQRIKMEVLHMARTPTTTTTTTTMAGTASVEKVVQRVAGLITSPQATSTTTPARSRGVDKEQAKCVEERGRGEDIEDDAEADTSIESAEQMEITDNAEQEHGISGTNQQNAPSRSSAIESQEEMEVTDYAEQEHGISGTNQQNAPSRSAAIESPEEMEVADYAEQEHEISANNHQNVPSQSAAIESPKEMEVTEYEEEEHAISGTNQQNAPSQSSLERAIQLANIELDRVFTASSTAYFLSNVLRKSYGLKQNILLTVLEMSFDEFCKCARFFIVDAETVDTVNDEATLQRCYRYVMPEPHAWPKNLYIPLADLIAYLRTRAVALRSADLEHVTPKVLHWDDLVACTDFDECVRFDYKRRHAGEEPKSDDDICLRRKEYYQRCCALDEWIWHAPRITDPELIALVCAAKDEAERILIEESAKPKPLLIDVIKARHKKEERAALKAVAKAENLMETLMTLSPDEAVVANTTPLSPVPFVRIAEEFRTSSDDEVEIGAEVVHTASGSSVCGYDQLEQTKSKITSTQLNTVLTQQSADNASDESLATDEIERRSPMDMQRVCGPQQNDESIMITERIDASQVVLQVDVGSGESEMPEKRVDTLLSPSIFPSSSDASQRHSGVLCAASAELDASDHFVEMQGTQQQIEALNREFLHVEDPLMGDTVDMELGEQEGESDLKIFTECARAGTALGVVDPPQHATQANANDRVLDQQDSAPAEPICSTAKSIKLESKPLHNCQFIWNDETDKFDCISLHLSQNVIVIDDSEPLESPTNTLSTNILEATHSSTPDNDFIQNMLLTESSSCSLGGRLGEQLPSFLDDEASGGCVSPPTAITSQPPPTTITSSPPPTTTTQPTKTSTSPKNAFVNILNMAMEWATGPTKNKPKRAGDFVPQIKHEFRPLPLRVVTRCTKEPQPQCSTSNAGVSDAAAVEVAATANSNSECDRSERTAISFSVSRALATDNTLFNSTTLLQAADQQQAAHESAAVAATLPPTDASGTNSNSSSGSDGASIATPAQVNVETLLCRRLMRLNYFEALKPAHIIAHKLQSNDIGGRYMQALISYGPRSLVYANNIGALLPHLTAAELRDVQFVLSDLQEFEYSIFVRKALEAEGDLRQRVLFQLIDTAPMFAYCRVTYDSDLRDFGRCERITMRNDATLHRRPHCALSAAVKPEILTQIAALKAKTINSS